MRRIPLNGEWSVDLGDGPRAGMVPGCWEQLTESKTLTGPVDYRTVVACPRPSPGGRWILAFDAVSYYCELTVNGSPIGAHEGLWDRFGFDVTEALRFDQPNEILLRIEKPGYSESDRYPLREVLSGFIPDVLCTFGGIWGDVQLIETPGFLPETCTVQTDLARGVATISVETAGTRTDGQLVVRLSREGATHFEATLPARDTGSGVALEVPLQGLRRWSLGEPALYDLRLTARTGAGEAVVEKRIGFREVTAEGERILLNGEPIYLRGALHWGCYPDRIIPRPSPAEIRREIEELRSLGFNGVKHCLYVPREEYFRACDEMGFLSWLELPLWQPRVTPAMEPRLEREYPRIIAQVAHHPSLLFYSLGCELGSEIGKGILERLYRLARQKSGGALVRDNSGSGECYGGLAEDFADFYDYHFYADGHNLEPLIESFTPRWRASRPWIFGEYADADTWRALPQGAPWWATKDERTNPISLLKRDFRLHLQRERLEAPGIRGRSELIGRLSLEHALLHRKLSLESTRAFPDVGGYNITSIRDVFIATSGIFDQDMALKFRGEDFLPFNADLVLVPRWDLARSWICGDRVSNADRFNVPSGGECSLRIVGSSFQPDISTGQWSWRIEDPQGSRVLAQGSGRLDSPLRRGSTRELFRVSAGMPETARPLALSLAVELRFDGGRAGNSWPLFVWPRLEAAARTGPARGAGPSAVPGIALHDPLDLLGALRRLPDVVDFDRLDGGGQAPRKGPVVAASLFDESLARYVERGGKAFLIQRGPGRFPHRRVAFWREGITLFEDHELASEMPGGRFRELQLYGMATDTALSWIEPQGKIGAVRPIITRVDAREFVATHYMLELAYGEGTLIVSTLRFEGGMGKQPSGLEGSSAAQFYLGRILGYLARS